MKYSDLAVFVDRDGTINVEVDYLSSPEQIRYYPRTASAIRELNDIGVRVIVITNQSGVARGLLSEEDVRRVHAAMSAGLLKEGARIDDYFYCPHHPEYTGSPYGTDCECRKPKPGMLKSAEKKYGLDLSRSFVVGDKCIDVQTGKSVGATGIQVATGYGTGERDLCTADRDYFADDLYAAVQYIKGILNRRP